MPVMDMQDAEDTLEKEYDRREREALKRSHFEFECICGRKIVTHFTLGWCKCGRQFDLTAWGKG